MTNVGVCRDIGQSTGRRDKRQVVKNRVLAEEKEQEMDEQIGRQISLLFYGAKSTREQPHTVQHNMQPLMARSPTD